GRAAHAPARRRAALRGAPGTVGRARILQHLRAASGGLPPGEARLARVPARSPRARDRLSRSRAEGAGLRLLLQRRGSRAMPWSPALPALPPPARSAGRSETASATSARRARRGGLVR